MPLYFFDTYENGHHSRDDVGLTCPSLAGTRMEAIKALPATAHDQIPKDSDRQAYSVVVRNEAGCLVYTATLSFAGPWLEQAA